MKKLFNFFSNKKKKDGLKNSQDESSIAKNSQDESSIAKEFNENIKIITDEYGEDIFVLPHNYGIAKVTADLLKKIKQLEEKIK